MLNPPPRLASPDSELFDAVIIENVTPLVDGGRHPVKRIPGEPLHASADVFKNGHDEMSAVLKWRKSGRDAWMETPMIPSDNDRWHAACAFGEIGMHEFAIHAWGDAFKSWQVEFRKKIEGGVEDLSTEIEEGARLLEDAARRAADADDKDAATTLRRYAASLRRTEPGDVLALAHTPELEALVTVWQSRTLGAETPGLPVWVDRERARFSAWYEFFPRNAKGDGTPSTFRDCLERVRYAKDLGFDIVYFPPIHPIGITNRKGRNNSLTCGTDNPGSPWAIGGPAGGHRTVEPALGTLDDFAWLVEETRKLGLEVALDFAINCSPDHPYVKDHPEWFYARPDGTIKYAENPPKKYEDIYPLNFHCEDWKNLWNEMVGVVRFWADHGVRVFRVDNPHTKQVAFWEYLITTIQAEHPDVLFLAEAFTMPKMMKALGKVGFTQSYTYFTWRTGKAELTDYATELTQGGMREYFRGNFWPNTPDILHAQLQNADPPIFKVRALLASTLSSSWGIYSGYEFCENDPFPGKEEYNNNEKYELRPRNYSQPGIKDFVAALNRIRRENPALQEYDNLRFFPAENDQILCYGKMTADKHNIIVIVVNLDPQFRREATVHLPVHEFALPDTDDYKVRDLLTGETYQWSGAANFVSLDPGDKPGHILRIER